MPNTFAPNGFVEQQRLGAAPNYQNSPRWIAYNNATPIYFGDPVVQLATGYIAAATPGTTQIAGIFAGCEYMSKSQRKPFWSPWWPATSDVNPGGTGFDVKAKVIDDPATMFRVQCYGQFTMSMLGLNGQFIIPASPGPNTLTGYSGAALDLTTNVPAATATFPFRIADIVRDPPGANGTDPTTPYSYVLVAFNNQDYKSLTGI